MFIPNPFPNTATINKIKPSLTQAGNNGTHISIILDASGSMISCYDQTISGFNEFVAGQRNAKLDKARLSLTQFDSPSIIHTFSDLDLDNVPELTKKNYRPRGGTNLYDAIGSTINDVERMLADKSLKNRPSVLIVIMTDGMENASTEFTSSSVIKDLVKAAEAADWGFIFMGANIDAFSVGDAIGTSALNTFSYNTANTGETYAAMSSAATVFRTAKMSNLSTQAIYTSGLVSDDQIKSMKGE